MNELPNIVVVVWDGLCAPYLGPYGNSWVPTPAIDELAATGTLAEWCVGDDLEVSSVYRAWWSGFPACRETNAQPDVDTLAARLSRRGYTTVCFSDDKRIAESALDEGFDTVQFTEVPRIEQLAANWEETFAAQSVMAAASQLADTSRPFFAWLHIGVMAYAWQSPWEWRASFGDEEDPDPSDSCVPPSARLASDTDPDVLLGYSHSYAAEVMLADACVGLLRDALAQSGESESTRWILTSPRGYELGDHGVVGFDADVLYSVSAQVPFLVGGLPQEHAMVRRRGFFQHADLYATCLSLSSSEHRHSWSRSLFETSAEPDRAVTLGKHARRLQTPAWTCLWLADDRFELYVHPDDRWQVSDVAARRPDIRPFAEAAWEQWREAARHGDRNAVTPLPKELREIGE